MRVAFAVGILIGAYASWAVTMWVVRWRHGDTERPTDGGWWDCPDYPPPDLSDLRAGETLDV